MVFACRRTRVWDPQDIATILDDDGYVNVKEPDVLPGDILVYYNRDTGDAEHSGIVLSEHDLFGGPLVVSKWGSFSETVHRAHNCPYAQMDIRYYRVGG